MTLRKIVNEESGVSMVIETVLLLGISVIFMSLVFLSFQSLNERQTEIVMKEEMLAMGNSIAKKVSDMNIEAKASLSSGSKTTINLDFNMPLKIADNTYTVKLNPGKIILESTTGPYVKVEVPINSDINVADNSTFYSSGMNDELQYDSLTSTIFLLNGGVIPVPDAVNPNIFIISPVALTTISNTTYINVSVSDNVGVTRVEYYIDGAYKYTTSSPFNWSWDTRTTLDGNRNVTAKAYDSAGNSASDSRIFNVSNLFTDPPLITVISPLSPTDFTKPTIKAHISDDVGLNISSIILFIDGVDKTPNASFVVGTSDLTYYPLLNMIVGSHSVNVSVEDTDSTIHQVWKNWPFDITSISDSINPTISIISPITSSEQNPGDPIKVQYTASDSGSGLDNVTLRVNVGDGNVYSTVQNLSTYPDIIFDRNPGTITLSNNYVSGNNYTYNITAFDRNGNKASITQGPIISGAGQSSELEVGTSSLTNSGKTISNIKLRDNNSVGFALKITGINVTWNNGYQIESVKINNNEKWSGSASSPSPLLQFTTIYPVQLTSENMDLKFSSNIPEGKDYTIVFFMQDGTTKKVSFNK
jgi:hypothetical protein